MFSLDELHSAYERDVKSQVTVQEAVLMVYMNGFMFEVVIWERNVCVPGVLALNKGYSQVL